MAEKETAKEAEANKALEEAEALAAGESKRIEGDPVAENDRLAHLEQLVQKLSEQIAEGRSGPDVDTEIRGPQLTVAAISSSLPIDEEATSKINEAAAAKRAKVPEDVDVMGYNVRGNYLRVAASDGNTYVADLNEKS